jgi:Protein of unknown function (DUF4013)
MPTLELVCKRLLSDPVWIFKCMLGAFLLAVPVAHFFACGYLYEIVNRARRGEPLELPDWDDWRRLFVNGVAAFVIFTVFTVLPLAGAWLLSRPLNLLGAGWFSYMPMMPVGLLCFPLTAASLYLYQKREDYRDAFRPWVLLAMIRSSWAHIIVPTLALVGALVTGLPLLTFTLFGVFAVLGATYGAIFQQLEATLRASARRA